MSELPLGKMTSITLSQIRSLLRGVIAAVPELDSMAVMTGDGNMIASVLSGGVNTERYAAMCASLLMLAERASAEIERGDLQQLLVAGHQGSMLLVRVNNQIVLAVSCGPQAQLGRILIEARKTAEKLAEMMR